MKGIQHLKQVYTNHPEIARAWCLQLEVLLSPDVSDHGAAKLVAEEVAMANNTGIMKVQGELLKIFHVLLWNLAQTFHSVTSPTLLIC
jgi:hypothetical protein